MARWSQHRKAMLLCFWLVSPDTVAKPVWRLSPDAVAHSWAPSADSCLATPVQRWCFPGAQCFDEKTLPPPFVNYLYIYCISNCKLMYIVCITLFYICKYDLVVSCNVLLVLFVVFVLGSESSVWALFPPIWGFTTPLKFDIC